MRHASLFSGIGGPEVAAAMLGWENVFHCEINEFGRKVLEYWFPESDSYEDITKTDFTKYRGTIDILTGGFPCQPFSYAGRRGGQSDERYLWPEMLRVINEVRPTWVIGENVAGIGTMVESCEVTDMGSEATLFEASGGIHRYTAEFAFTIERICSDLESKGYSVQPMLIPACAVGAPHRRDRVFFIAHNNFASDSINQGSLRNASTNATKEGKERLSERNEVQWSNEPADARSQMCDIASDSNGGGSESYSQSQGTEGIRRDPISEPSEWCKQTEFNNGLSEFSRIVTDSESEQSDRCGIERESSEEKQIESRRRSGEDATSEHDVTTDSSCEGLERSHESWSGEGKERMQVRRNIAGCDSENESKSYSYSYCNRLLESLRARQDDYKGWSGQEFFVEVIADSIGRLHPSERWHTFPTVSPVHRGNDGIPFDVDSLTISFSKWRTETIKAYGNAIVPQVMYRIFEAIEAVENNTL